MNRLEHLLTILGEEGAELAQTASKANRFGVFEQRDLPTSNAERMQIELNDVIAMVRMLNIEIPELNLHFDEQMIQAKIVKVERYLLYSKECGTLVTTE